MSTTQSAWAIWVIQVVFDDDQRMPTILSGQGFDQPAVVA